MGVPANIVQVQGQSAVSADQLNTYAQITPLVANLRNFIGISNMAVMMEGTTAVNDGGQGFFYWNATGTAPDDNGATTVVPNGVTTGEWTRLTSNNPTTTSATGYLATGAFVAAFTNGMVMDYSPLFGRFSTGAGAGFKWFNAGVANTLLMTLSSAGALTLASGLTVTGAIAGVTTLATSGNVTIGGTLGVTGAITPNSTAGIVGTITNDSVNAGGVGEYVVSNIASGAAVSLTTDIAANVTSISLTAGDWDVGGVIVTKPGASTTQANFSGCLNTASATYTVNGSQVALPYALSSAGLAMSAPLSTLRFSLATTTTIYMVAQITFGVSTNAAYGTLWARRRR